MIRSTWRANPLAKGAYTYVAVGASTDPSLLPLAVPFSDLPLSCPESFSHGRYFEEHHHERLWSQCRRETLLCRRAHVGVIQRDCPRCLRDWPGAHLPAPPLISHASPTHTSNSPLLRPRSYLLRSRRAPSRPAQLAAVRRAPQAPLRLSRQPAATRPPPSRQTSSRMALPPPTLPSKT